MGYTTYERYTLTGYLSNASPADSTAYLIGLHGALSTNVSYQVVYIPSKGTIRRVYVHWKNQTQDCTAEDTTLSINLNNTTDYAVYTGTFANAASPQTAANVNCPVSVGDYITLKFSTPAWVTNPTGVYLYWIAEIQC